MNYLKKEHPATVWGLRRHIARKVKAAGILTGNSIPSLHALFMSLNSTELKRFYALVNGDNCMEHVAALSKVLSWHIGENATLATKLYLAFHGPLRGMKATYKNNSEPDEIIRWIAHSGISLVASVKEPYRFAAVVHMLQNIHEETEYSSVTHTSDLKKSGLLKWGFRNPDQVWKAIEVYREKSDPRVSPGMVEAFHGEQPTGSEFVDGWEARTYIYSSINGSTNEDQTVDIISGLSDDEAVSVYQGLVGSEKYAAHGFIRDVFSHENDVENILKFLQAYAYSGELLHVACGQYSAPATAYEHARWLFYNEVFPDDPAGFRAAVEVASRIVLPWTSAVVTRIGQLAERGLLGTAYARPDEVERLIEIYHDSPERHHFHVELLESHNALTDGVL